METSAGLIREDQFEKAFDSHISPFLIKYRKEKYLEVRPGQSVYSLWYQIEKPKAAILISHGFSESCRKYDELVYYLLSNHYSVVVMAHCGHDRSYRLCDDPNLVHIDHFERYVNDLTAVAKELRWKERHVPLFLFGHSMGGAIAVCACEQAWNLFSGLILSSPMIRPNTGNVYWRAARTICTLASLTHHEQDYLPGHHPYQEEFFEDSASTSRARFEAYKKLRQKDPKIQTCAGSMKWLEEAFRMEQSIYKNIHLLRCPVLMFQAGKETFVDNNAQNAFFASLPEKLWKEKVYMPLSRHEIYASTDDTLPLYIHSLLTFLQDCLQKERSSRSFIRK